MLNSRQKFGKEGESIAAIHLLKSGYQIIAQNYHTRYGEIDIIAKDGDTLVFAEVKSRRNDSFGNPKYAVTLKKQQKMSMAALDYLKNTKQSHIKARFDVVAICSGEENPDIEIIRNAFELAV